MKKEEKNPVYIICPRCDLNYINKKDKVCTVCKAEMGLVDPSILIPDEEEAGIEKFCPVCKINYIAEDEEMCFLCLKEHDDKSSDKSDIWDYESVIDDDQTEEEIVEEFVLTDEDELEDEEEDGSEFKDKYKEPNDFDFDVDDSDFEDIDEDEDEYEDEDDDF